MTPLVTDDTTVAELAALLLARHVSRLRLSFRVGRFGIPGEPEYCELTASGDARSAYVTQADATTEHRANTGVHASSLDSALSALLEALPEVSP